MDHYNTKQSPKPTRQQRGIIGALLILCYFSAQVMAFSSPSRMITMKAEVAVQRSPKTTSLGRSTNNISPGSPLSMRSMDQQEFELHVGHAMDVLRDDYPGILTDNPDYTIYDEELELIDPSGVHLLGVKNYKAAFSLLHAVVGIFYCPEQSTLKHRMCFDKARQNIRIHWNAEVIPKAIFGGYKSTLHVDGISVYEFSRISGNITQHRIERLVINDTPIVPEKGIFAALRGYAVKSKVDGIPVFNAALPDFNENQLLRFRNFSPVSSGSILFSEGESSSQLSAVGGSSEGDTLYDALEKKNAAREKFGLAPLTPEEFTELMEQVGALDAKQQQRSAAAAAEMAAKKKKEEQGGFFKKLFGNALEDTCQSNFDCQRPEVCCDFGFTKKCCTSGMRVLDGPQSRKGNLAEVPVIANPGPNYPPLGPPGRF